MIGYPDLDYTIDCLNGYFHEHVLKAKCIVGQMSTAVIETVYHGIPYYIYEPYENGRPDEMLNSSKIFSLDTIARTPEQLKRLISEGKGSVFASKDYIFDGESFSNIDLRHCGVF